MFNRIPPAVTSKSPSVTFLPVDNTPLVPALIYIHVLSITLIFGGNM